MVSLRCAHLLLIMAHLLRNPLSVLSFFHHGILTEFQGGRIQDHCNELKYSSLALYNKIVIGLRNGNLGMSFVDVVLKASNIIEETTCGTICLLLVLNFVYSIATFILVSP